MKEQLTRDPLPFPVVTLNPSVVDIDMFVAEDITLENYQAHPPLKAEIANVGGFDDKKKN